MEEIKIYTDGACSGNPGAGGWAYAFKNSKNKVIHSYGGSSETTNNRMELSAVLNALEDIYDNGLKYHDIVIVSDSAYVVNAINQNWLEKWFLNNWKTAKCENVKNRDLWERLYYLRSDIRKTGYSIKFEKVKGHAGNEMNELVDKLARSQALIYKAGNSN